MTRASQPSSEIPDPEVARHEVAPKTLTEDQIADGRHRRLVGAQWDTMGRKQLDFLVEHGLRPDHRLLDVACGSLRAGRHLVDYLEPGNYYGIDHSADLIDAGYYHELDDAQRQRLPRENLTVNGSFRVADLGQTFDVALANSLFSHLNLSHVRLCMARVAEALDPGGRFFATFFEMDEDAAVDAPGGKGGKQRSYRNPYWHYRSDMEWAASRADADFTYIGDWGHPVGQRMFCLTRR
jgi:SAM-dependent methyltransferase